MPDNHQFKITPIPAGGYLVSGSIPDWGIQNGKGTDQVRRVVHDAKEADRLCAELQASRANALRARELRKRRGSRTVETFLSRSELDSAEAAARVINEKGDARTILQLVMLGLGVREKKDKPLSGLVDGFVKAKADAGLAPRSAASLEGRVRQFVRECGDHPSPAEICAWMNVPDSRDGRKNRRADAGNFLGWCVREGHIAENPVRRIPVPKHKADMKIADLTPQVLSAEDADQLLQSARDLHKGRLVAYVALALFAGLRPSEIGRLAEGGIDLDQGHIVVLGKVRHRDGKRKERLVPIEPNLAAILKDLRLSDQVLCVDSHAKERALWAAVRAAAGLLEDWGPDCLRHSYCSYRLARGDEVAQVARDGGHSEATLLRYYHHPRTKDEAAGYWQIGMPCSAPGARA